MMTKGALPWILLGLAGCASPGPAKDPGGSSGDEAQAPDSSGAGSKDDQGAQGGPVPTYFQDVLPIYAKRCLGCHQKGGAGAFSLDTYEEAKAFAGPSAHAVQSRSMPPWLVRDDESCGSYRDSQALSDAEIKTIVRWAKGGAPKGKAAEVQRPPVKSLKDFVELATPSYVPKSKGGALTKSDEYRCFLLKNPSLDKRRFITGYEVLPGNAALVHHAVLFSVQGDAKTVDGVKNSKRLQEMDELSPNEAGWPCYSMVGEGVDPVDLPVVWAPGQGAVEYPRGSGSIVDPGDLLVLQVHYNLADPSIVGQSDSSRLRLRLAEQVERQSIGLAWDDLLETLALPSPTVIPPGESAFVFESKKSFEGFGFSGLEYVDIQGFMPHMHGAGQSQRLELLAGGETRCLSDVPRWDFDWQLAYFFQEPLRLRPGHSLSNRCVFNTTSRGEATLPGWGTRNEMCLATLYVLMPPGIMTR